MHTHTHTHTPHTQEIRKGYPEFRRLLNCLLIFIIYVCESHWCYLAYLPGFSSEHKVGLQSLALRGQLQEQECCAFLPETSFKSQCGNCHPLFFSLTRYVLAGGPSIRQGSLELGQCRREGGQEHGQERHLVFLHYWDWGVTFHHSLTLPLWLIYKPQKSHGLLRNSHVYTAYLGTDSQRPTLYLFSLFEQHARQYPAMLEAARTPAGSHTSILLCKSCPKLLT